MNNCPVANIRYSRNDRQMCRPPQASLAKSSRCGIRMRRFAAGIVTDLGKLACYCNSECVKRLHGDAAVNIADPHCLCEVVLFVLTF